MDQYVKQCIQVRRQSVEDYFTVPDSVRPQVEALFAEMEALGEQCPDTARFEAAFAESGLSARYNQLFASLKPRTGGMVGAVANSYEAGLKDPETRERWIEQDLEYAADTLTQPIRHRIHEEVMDKVYDTPILGEAVTASRAAGVLGRLLKKK